MGLRYSGNGKNKKHRKNNGYNKYDNEKSVKSAGAVSAARSADFDDSIVVKKDHMSEVKARLEAAEIKDDDKIRDGRAWKPKGIRKYERYERMFNENR